MISLHHPTSTVSIVTLYCPMAIRAVKTDIKDMNYIVHGDGKLSSMYTLNDVETKFSEAVVMYLVKDIVFQHF